MTATNPTRLTATEHCILSLLGEIGEAYGLLLVEKSNGVLRRGSIYVLLSRLENRGFVKSRYVEPATGQQGPSRRLYKATDNGERALMAWKAAQRAWK